MNCKFSIQLLIVTTILCRFYPNDVTITISEPSPTVRLVPLVNLNVLEVVSLAKRPSHLHFSLLRKSRCKQLLSICTILLSGDIELNPGPQIVYKFPCGVCAKPVKCNQKGILCEVCDNWIHTRCIGISDNEYRQLQSSEDPWCCKKCVSEAMPYADVPSDDSVFNSSLDRQTSVIVPPLSMTPVPTSLPLTILYANCRSLFYKLDELRVMIATHNPHMICLCETWLDETIDDSDLSLPGFHLVRRDRNRHGGGLVVYTQESLSCNTLLSHKQIEMLILEVSTSNLNLTCALVYRPPSSDATILHEIEESLERLPATKTKSLLLIGDFNINITVTSNPILSSIQATHNLKQVISTPTRNTLTTQSLIDHAYLSKGLRFTVTTISPLSTSDHCAVLLSLQSHLTARRTPNKRNIWLYQHADWDTANDKLASFSYDNTTNNCVTDVSTLWRSWYSHFMSTMKDSIPMRKTKISNNVPYLSQHLCKLLRKKHNLYSSAKKHPTASAWSKYNRFRNHVTSALRSAKTRFFNHLTKKLNSPRDFWKSYHKLSSKSSRIPGELHMGAVTESSPQGKANLLNNFFSSCFSPLPNHPTEAFPTLS